MGNISHDLGLIESDKKVLINIRVGIRRTFNTLDLTSTKTRKCALVFWSRDACRADRAFEIRDGSTS